MTFLVQLHPFRGTYPSAGKRYFRQNLQQNRDQEREGRRENWSRYVARYAFCCNFWMATLLACSRVVPMTLCCPRSIHAISAKTTEETEGRKLVGGPREKRGELCFLSNAFAPILLSFSLSLSLRREPFLLTPFAAAPRDLLRLDRQADRWLECYCF